MKNMTTLLWMGLVFVLAGCNTLKGMGQDVQKAGSVIENAAKK